LRIEQLGNGNNNKIVGITELHNSNRLKQEELIQLAKSLSGDSLTVQLLNGLLIADETHLLSAAQNALNAKQGEYMLSRSLDVEIIVFASAQRQIGRALDALGVFDGLDEIAVVVVGTDTSSVEDTIQILAAKIGNEVIPSFTATSERIEQMKNHYQISDKEIKAISDSDKIESQLVALSRCLVSRVSLVAFDS
jgi:tRNA threonylcarbamoyladenosine modification (KEOPS) complex Cgi121 subunit